MATHVVVSGSVGNAERFRDRLRRELARRCTCNPRYSLRAFANYLGIDHATLSQLLRGKREFTASSIRRLAQRLGLGTEDVGRYVEAQQRPAPAASNVRTLADDAARVLGDWLPFAVLELTRLAEFRPDVRWVARMLGVEPDAVKVALQHLVRLGFLQMTTPDRWVDLTSGAVHREEDFGLAVLLRLAARSRELQIASARNAPAAARLHGSATLALRVDQIPALIGLCERCLAEARGQANGRDAEAGAEVLYQLDLHCIPLTSTKGAVR